MAQAAEDVRARLARAAGALENAGVPYTIAGDNAVASWVGRKNRAAVRLTQNVDLIIRRVDFDAAAAALASAGFIHRRAAGVESFLDGPAAKARDALYILFAGERVRPNYEFPAAEVSESERTEEFRVLTLEALVRMKLTSYRRKDQVHLLDMMGVDLIDESWCRKLPPLLADRLKLLIDTRDDEPDLELLDPPT
ncbi:MAG TPA: hypothetical protein VKU82_00325 [Planctomycetaceae bacterium]|nr:hypothetical protein [Planctomycetaceae bacterium]